MILKDRVAVVTGAARGIGREIALLMAQLGARVVVNDYGGSEAGQGTTQAPANEVVEEIRKAGGDRKSTRLNSSHLVISYAVFCLKKKKMNILRFFISHCVYFL